MKSIAKKYSLYLIALLMGMSGVAVVPFFGTQQASAASTAGFKAGFIISDNIFTNSQTMTPGQIQDFLNSKVPSCDTNGSQPYGGTTRAAYAASRGVSTPFVCLKNYSENGIGAAQLIYNAAQQYRINPQVLLVLLQKEQGLITDDWPWPVQYRTATGYGCPDTAPCDSQYYGLTNQLGWAAKMFRSIMDNNPNWYTPYILGNNSIRYSPNASCGSSLVNIQNRATQALYNYTPYQPNQAALDAGYGNGDACSAHGNRNFYLYFSDWFGSPQYGNLVRTPENGTVYLISGTKKYPIGDITILGALYPLGGVSYVNQSYLDGYTTGPLMGRVIKSSNGTIYFFDAGIKLNFGSCAQVEDYGSSCGQALALEDSQINQLITGPGMTNVFGTTSGKSFYISGGKKREAYDNASLTQAGISTAANVLNESAISGLAYGAPVIRSNVVVSDRSNGQQHLYSNSAYNKLSSTQANYTYVKSLASGALDNASLAQGQINANFNGFVTDATTGNKYILMPQGKVQLTAPSAWGASMTSVESSFVTGVPTASDPVNNGIVMANGSGTVYFVTGGQKRPIPGWGNLVDLKVQPLTINTIDAAALNAIPTGPLIYAPGHVVKTTESANVYVVKSYSELMPISSFVFPQELGASSVLETMSKADFNSYTVSSTVQTQITCSGQKYVGIGGKLYPMSDADITKFGLGQAVFVDGGMLCTNLPKTTQTVPEFLLDNTGTIYLVQSGTKRAFAGYGAYVANGGTSQNTIRVSNHFTGLIPSGANITQ